MSFKLYMENWDVHGSSATPEDEVYAQKTLLDAMRRMVKNFDRMSDGSPNVGYKTNPQFLGRVKDFFPNAEPRMANVTVFFDPKANDCAAYLVSNGNHPKGISIGKKGLQGKGSSGTLGATFIHEVEHLWDLVNGQGTVHTSGKVSMSEFTPRLRQMIRGMKSSPNNPIWYMVPGYKQGRDNAEMYVSSFFDRHGERGKEITPEEREFAVQSVMKRAQEIFDQENEEYRKRYPS